MHRGEAVGERVVEIEPDEHQQCRLDSGEGQIDLPEDAGGFVDAWLQKKTKISEISVWIGILAVSAMVGLTVWEAVVEH